MESQFKNEKIRRLFYCLIFFSACSEKDNPKKHTMPTVSKIRNGDFIYRLGNGLFSDFIKDMSRFDKRFSHVGIVYKSHLDDSVFVIHAEADDHTGIGLVKKETLAVFLHKVRDWGVFRIKTSEKYRKKIADYAFDYQEKQIPFDTSFDESDSSAFYCTELLKHCINNALNQELVKAKTVKNNKAFIAIDDTYLIDSMELIEQNLKNAPKY
jgi:Permuted papain-like amidase enzyme, YaeF/YiiX, C92 family